MKIKAGDYVVFKPIEQCDNRQNILEFMKRVFDGNAHKVKSCGDFDGWFVLDNNDGYYYQECWIDRKLSLEDITI